LRGSGVLIKAMEERGRDQKNKEIGKK